MNEKSHIKLLIFCIALLTPFSLYADTLGFQVGAGSWSQDADGELSTDEIPEYTLTKGDASTIIWASLEHPVPLLPNLKFATLPVESSNSNGDELNVDLTDFTLYYELLDNVVNLDLGLTARSVDGTAKVVAGDQEDDFSAVIPMLYAKASVDILSTGLSVGGEINTIGVYRDISLYVAYEFDFGLGLQAGKRTMTIDFDEDDISSSLENDGMYFAAYFHF